MDVLGTILACSLYADDALVRAIAQSNSRGNPYSVMDLTLDASQMDAAPEPRQADEAVARMHAVMAKGGRPLVGLMQLTPAWIASFGRSDREAFDPCTNVALGSALLSQFDYECAVAEHGDPHRTDARRRDCVMQKYGEGLGMQDFVTVTKLELRFQRAMVWDEHVPEAPILFEAGAGAPASDRLLVTLRSVPGRAAE